MLLRIVEAGRYGTHTLVVLATHVALQTIDTDKATEKDRQQGKDATLIAHDFE